MAFVFIRFVPTKASVDIGTMISTAQQYLTEQKYEQAAAEFKKLIDIDPKNVDAYIGLAKAYIGLGDTNKAVEVLEDGYDKTGDERILKMLEELKPSKKTTVETTTESSVENATETTANVTETTTTAVSEITLSMTIEDEAKKIQKLAFDNILSQFILPYYDDSKANSTITAYQKRIDSVGNYNLEDIRKFKCTYDENGITISQINTSWDGNNDYSYEIYVNGATDGKLYDTYYKAGCNMTCDNYGSGYERSLIAATFISVESDNHYSFKDTYGQWDIEKSNDEITCITYTINRSGSEIERQIVWNFNNEESTWLCMSNVSNTTTIFYPIQIGLPSGCDESIFNIPSDVDSYVMFDNWKDLQYYREQQDNSL